MDSRSLKIYYRFNTASGKYCCNQRKLSIQLLRQFGFNTASGKYCCNLSSATKNLSPCMCFNTASGKYCCNGHKSFRLGTSSYHCVSIPQAVSTVATVKKAKAFRAYVMVSIPQAVSTVATTQASSGERYSI